MATNLAMVGDGFGGYLELSGLGKGTVENCQQGLHQRHAPIKAFLSIGCKCSEGLCPSSRPTIVGRIVQSQSMSPA